MTKRQDETEEHSFDELTRAVADGTFTRRRMLKFTGGAFLGGALSTAFPGMAEARRRGRQNNKHQRSNFGYDPTVDEPVAITSPPTIDVLPSWAVVHLFALPPVGSQHTPNCAAWSSTYGLATYTAALAGNYAPIQPSQQASSAYIYIQVMQQNGVPQNTCQGSQLTSYFHILAQGGTPTMEEAPYVPNCSSLWTAYGSQNLQPDSAFTINSVAAVNAKENPDDVKQVIASGGALAYGTSLYTDFPHYNGDKVPYTGNGTILINPKIGKPDGHCMLIIGYDDNLGGGAFLIQNSFGSDWGSNGFIWMAYETFTTLAQGAAFYVNS